MQTVHQDTYGSFLSIFFVCLFICLLYLIINAFLMHAWQVWHPCTVCHKPTFLGAMVTPQDIQFKAKMYFCCTEARNTQWTNDTKPAAGKSSLILYTFRPACVFTRCPLWTLFAVNAAGCLTFTLEPLVVTLPMMAMLVPTTKSLMTNLGAGIVASGGYSVSSLTLHDTASQSIQQWPWRWRQWWRWWSWQ